MTPIDPFVRLYKSVVSIASVHRPFLVRDLQEFGSLVGPQQCVLDVGSGVSPYRQFFDVETWWRIDIDCYRGKQDVVADACRLPFRDGTINVIILTEVLEHLACPQGALLEAYRVLIPSGWIILTTPLLWGVHDTSDFFRFTESALRYMLTNIGFEVYELRSRGGILAAIAGLLSQVPAQLLPSSKTRMTGPRYCMRLLLLTVLLPVIVSIRKLDGCCYQSANFTLGYSILARKVESSQGKAEMSPTKYRESLLPCCQNMEDTEWSGAE